MSKTSPDTFDIAAQEAAREEADKRSRERAKVEAADLSWVMDNPRGRRFIHGFLERGGAFRSSFHTNALTMAFNEGRRNEALELTARIHEACPSKWQAMLNEQKANPNE